MIKYLAIQSIISLCINAQTYCWDESERKQLTFINNANKLMDFLPTIRLIQGYYPSQFAMQYTAYVYLKEQMGIDVEFYPQPTDNNQDPANTLIERYTDYTEWCQSNNADPNTCNENPPYPIFYYQDIADNKYDLLFEVWDSVETVANGQEYYYNKTVNYVGSNGVYGDADWFLPKYIYDDDLTYTLLPELMTNDVIRNDYKAATQSYVTEWQQIWGNNLDSYPFDNITGDSPIILGSNVEYLNSQQSYAMTQNLLNNTWQFAAFGSESKLSEIISELYDAQLPFIANIYSPHQDFAIGDREFEKIAIPRNTDNSAQAQCYVDATCDFPLTPLMKLGNPLLESTFPEIHAFIQEFRMSSSDVNEIIKNYEMINDNISEHEKWLNASCDWLKTHSSITDFWFKTVTRYDCDEFNDGMGCGFNYYYESESDARSETNAIDINHMKIGGKCVHDTSRLECECTDDTLDGIYTGCKSICPGLLGPILDIDSGNYSFIECSGYGECDRINKKCQCRKGFAGDGCHIEYEVFTYPNTLFAIFSAIIAVLMVILIVLWFWTFSKSRFENILLINEHMTSLFCFGILLLCITTFIELFHPQKIFFICTPQQYIFGFGMVFTSVPIILRANIVKTIFGYVQNTENVKRVPMETLHEALNRKTKRHYKKQSKRYFYKAVSIQLFISILYTLASFTMNPSDLKTYDDISHQILYSCHVGIIGIIEDINLLYTIILLSIMSYRCYHLKHAKQVFSEINCGIYAPLIGLIATIFYVLMVIMVHELVYLTSFINVLMIIYISGLITLFFGPKLHRFYIIRDRKKKKSISNKVTQSQSSSTTDSTLNDDSSKSSSKQNQQIEKLQNAQIGLAFPIEEVQEESFPETDDLPIRNSQQVSHEITEMSRTMTESASNNIQIELDNNNNADKRPQRLSSPWRSPFDMMA